MPSIFLHSQFFRGFLLLLFILFLKLPALAAAPAGAAREDEDQLLQSTIVKAKEQIALGNLADALKRLQNAYASVPTPALLWPIAELHLRLEQPIEGLATLDKYIAQVPVNKMPHGQQMPQVEYMQEQLRQQLAKLVITAVDANATVTVDGQALDMSVFGQPQAVNPGRHRIESRLADRTLAREVRLLPRQELRLDMRQILDAPSGAATGTLAKQPDDRAKRMRRTAYLIIGSLGAAALITGGVLWGLDISSRCSDVTMCAPERDLKTPGVGLVGAGLGLGSSALVLGLIDFH